MDKKMPAESRKWWWAAACATAPVVVFALVYPVLEMGFNDEWQFLHMARATARTGRIAYDSWTAPMSLPLAYWGAAVVRIFGFSYLGLRLSVLPFWAGAGLLVYLLGRKLELPSGHLFIASLSTALSPVAISIGTTFSTDMAAFSLTLLAIYCALCAANCNRWKLCGWLAGAVAAGGLAGMTRDVYWSVAVWSVAVVGLLRWREPLARTGSALFAALAMGGAVASTRWHYSQANTVSQAEQWHGWNGMENFLVPALYIGLTGLLMCLPTFLPLLSRAPALRGLAARIVAMVLGVMFSALVWMPGLYLAPWVGNLWTQYGSFYNNQVLIGDRPVILGLPLRWLLGCVVLVSAAVCTGAAIQVSGERVSRLRRTITGCHPVAVFALITVPFACGYIALLALRGPGFIYDRYLLPVSAIASLLAVFLATRMGTSRPGIGSAIALVILTAFGIANTRDLYASHRATLAAAGWLSDRGVARRAISAGYEYDGWTQLESKGVMSRECCRNRPVRIWYEPMTDAVEPCYYVVTSPQPEMGPVVHELEYKAWLPPATRRLIIQRASSAECH